MFTTGLKEFKEVNEKNPLQLMKLFNKLEKTIIQYIIAKFLESKLVDNEEQQRLEIHCDLNHQDMMKEIDSYFVI